MGYCTRFSLDVMESINPIWDWMPTLRAIDIDTFNMFSDDGESWDAYKWYQHEEDMLKISKLYEDVVFVLKGEGEEAGDIWIKYFKDGKMQCCKAQITFEEYDESKLK